jgi:multidrug efflux pump subunit AcrB
MSRFNLSEWAITHRPLVLFIILILGAAGAYSYLNLGRAEDPSFTIKNMVVNVTWPGATASEMQTQVADRIEKKLQELPWLDRVETYSQPGVSFIQVILEDRTPSAQVKNLWYQVRKKVGDIRGELPAGITGPNFNDEYGDVYSVVYMLTADGLSLADLKARAEDIRQRLLRVPNASHDELEHNCIAHLDALGFRYYIPALMLSVLNRYDASSMRVIGTLGGLYPKKDSLWEHAMAIAIRGSNTVARS